MAGKETKGDLPSQVIMDLGDFVPEETDLRFTISSRKYAFHWTEASVEEVFRLMLEEGTDDPKGVYEARRRIVTRFLQGHIVEGNKDELAGDLALVPYRSSRGSLEIEGLFVMIQTRVKKKREWGVPGGKAGVVWIVRQVAFLMRASKGGLTHEAIMRLTWRQFGVYLDAFTWLLREESKEGQQKNRRDDLAAEARDPRVKTAHQKLLEETKRRTAKHLKNKAQV